MLTPPPEHRGSQSESASDAQVSSHATLQQNGSTAQTVASQPESLHNGVGLATQQSLVEWAKQKGSQSESASDAQAPSHETLQQNGSTAQTVASQPGSSQNGTGA
jgi:hypothetical protein